jgi:adenylate kinase
MKSFLKKIIAGLIMVGFSFSSAQGNAGDALKPKAPLVLVLLGPPGSGKGTQAQLIKDKYQLTHISTGDLLREHIRQGSKLGKMAKSYMDQGKLVPDELIFEILFERVSKDDCVEGYILDGFPRTLSQAETLQTKLPKGVSPIVINLTLSDREVIQRLSGRVTCEKCGSPYQLVSSPPKKAGICDRCQGHLIHRSDDTEAVISQRLKVYHDQTKPLIAFYDKLHTLHSVSCSQPKDKVFADVVTVITLERKHGASQ